MTTDPITPEKVRDDALQHMNWSALEAAITGDFSRYIKKKEPNNEG